MAITDADRDAVVAALEEWTTTTGEAYVRARAFACQTDCTPTTVEQILAALAGKNLRGVDLEPPTHLEVAVWRENAQYTTYRVVDTSTDTESDTASDQEATDDDTDADEELVVTAGTSCRRVPAVATTSRTWNSETGACESCGEPLTDTAPSQPETTTAQSSPSRQDETSRWRLAAAGGYTCAFLGGATVGSFTTSRGVSTLAGLFHVVTTGQFRRGYDALSTTLSRIADTAG